MEATVQSEKDEQERNVPQEKNAAAVPSPPLSPLGSPLKGVMPKHEDQNGSASDAPEDRYKAAATPSVTPRGTEVNTKSSAKPSSYGQPKRVLSVGNFPQPGSMLGRFFCLGRLGKGTFCSIHKCISLEEGDPRLVAAKVELGEFINSGVLEGEATMLQHLDNSLPPKTVPKYMGLYKSNEAAAIVMEYLPGEDMHFLREQGGRQRRVSVKDSVYLTADVMLPLLQEMHKAGVVHRDVKPSNCVRYTGKQFAMVDFGLSKSILVPRESPHADTSHAWPQSNLCLRKERPTADFRGTSMYASLRVHQSRDYSRRDDIWSLLYVFCDLASGGLPWMSYAATRERDMCRQLKDRIHKEDDTEQMLMGEDYHVSKYKRDMAEQKGATELPPLAEPLSMSKDKKKVQSLSNAFKHVASLNFADEPDYDLIRRCLHEFLQNPVQEDSSVADIDWENLDDSLKTKSGVQKWKEGIPTWELEDSPRDIDEELWFEAEAERAKIPAPKVSVYGSSDDFSKLPVEWQYRIAQMEYSAKKMLPMHVVLRDFMQCALPLVYGTWDSQAYEWGQNLPSREWYRREVYYKLITKCLNCAGRFNNFCGRSCFYETDEASARPSKRRKIAWSMAERKGTISNDMAAVSRVLFALEEAKKAESRKGPAPLSHM
jgi:tau tubulin kinase